MALIHAPTGVAIGALGALAAAKINKGRGQQYGRQLEGLC